MSVIEFVEAFEVLDSRGNPTLKVILTSDLGVQGEAQVPSGASTGTHEAVELRDFGKRYMGKGVQKAISNVTGPIAEEIVGCSIFDQAFIDRLLCEKDGTENKARLGANAILGVSLALSRLAANSLHVPLYNYLGGILAYTLPCPMMNVINGGVHADSCIEFQEFMIRPKSAHSFGESVRMGSEVFHTLKALLKEKGLATTVGDEGGFAPFLNSNKEALDLLLEAIEKAGYKPGEDISLALDCAATEFYEEKSGLYVGKKEKGSLVKRTSAEQVAYLKELAANYPIDSIEDGLAEGDWEGWKLLTEELGDKIQLVGDDLFVTNPKFLEKGIQLEIANSILIKVNQIGTLSETFETIRMAKQAGYTVIISHRSGETEDAFISDLSVAVGSGQIKAGSLSRTDRVAKYNRLMEIEYELGKSAVFVDSNPYSYLLKK